MKTFKEFLIQLKACDDARGWAGDKTIDEVVETCHRGDWLLWLAKKVEIDSRLLTLAKGHCAATVLHLMKDQRSKDAVKAAIDFGNGKIDRGQLDAAAYAAADADAYADAASAAAAADAYASAADAADAAAAAAADAYASAADAADAAAAADAAYASAADAADAAYAAADAAYADAADARKKNQKQTADICRKYIGEEIKRLVKNQIEKEGVEQGYRQATSKEPYNEPTQDELWEEMFRVDEEEGTQEVKKRYRITRI